MPSSGKNIRDYYSTNTSTKLENLGINKTKTKASGHDTYSEDDDNDWHRSSSRPKISSQTFDDNNNYHNPSLNQSNSSSKSGINKKRKVVGASGSNRSTSIRTYNDDGPKSFRTSFETLPEETPWSPSMKAATKSDDFKPKVSARSSLTNDITKRTSSPLVNDIRPYSMKSMSKHINSSDEDDDAFDQKPKAKVRASTIISRISSFELLVGISIIQF